MRNPQNSLRFYIDQADDKAVIRAVPVKPVVTAPRTAPGATTPEPTVNDGARTERSDETARRATVRVGRLVHRHGRKQS